MGGFIEIEAPFHKAFLLLDSVEFHIAYDICCDSKYIKDMTLA